MRVTDIASHHCRRTLSWTSTVNCHPTTRLCCLPQHVTGHHHSSLSLIANFILILLYSNKTQKKIHWIWFPFMWFEWFYFYTNQYNVRVAITVGCCCRTLPLLASTASCWTLSLPTNVTDHHHPSLSLVNFILILLYSNKIQKKRIPWIWFIFIPTTTKYFK